MKEKGWHMTDEEMKIMYSQCRSPRNQVRIIAELNARTKEDTMDKLESLGFDRNTMYLYTRQHVAASNRPIGYKPVKNGGKKWSDSEIQTMLELHGKGMTYAKIGEAIGRTKDSVRSKHQTILEAEEGGKK